MRYNKGLLSIIYTIAIILIGLAAVALLGINVIKIVNNPQLGPQTFCTNLQISPPLSILDACYRASTGDLEIRTLRTNEATQLSDVTFAVSVANERLIWSCGNVCGSSCILQEPGDIKSYYLNINSPVNSVQISVYIGSCDVQTKEIITCA